MQAVVQSSRKEQARAELGQKSVRQELSQTLPRLCGGRGAGAITDLPYPTTVQPVLEFLTHL